MSNILVSVCIPAYNQSLFINECIYSALNQTYSNLEVIVVDDRSTDGTWDEIDKINDNRLVKIRNKKNIGMVNNFRKCLDLVNGKYVTLLNGDDMLHKKSIEIQIPLFENNKNIAFSYGLVEKMGNKSGTSKIIQNSIFQPNEWCVTSLSLADNFVFQVGTIIRKKFLPKNPISDLLYFDWLLWLELGYKNSVEPIDEVVGYYRSHENSATFLTNKNFLVDDYINLDLVLINFNKSYDNEELISQARKRLFKRYYNLLKINRSKIQDYLKIISQYFF